MNIAKRIRFKVVSYECVCISQITCGVSLAIAARRKRIDRRPIAAREKDAYELEMATLRNKKSPANQGLTERFVKLI